MNKVAIIGTGYVGLVTGTCLSDFGMNVTCVDNDIEKIQSLRNGIVPIYEPGLNDLVNRNLYYKRLAFTEDIKSAIEDNQVIFIAVGTPPKEDGSADLKYVEEVAESIGQYINDYKVVVNKSTVPIGTGTKINEIISKKIKERGLNIEFDVVSNPEFLREGSAIQDFMHTDRVVIGAKSEKAVSIMKQVYRVLYLNETPFVVTNIETAELIKYASNSFLATKISFVNELTELCEKIGANIQHVSKAMGMDKRIGDKFLHAGPGYGGSCFPKDTRAMINVAKEYGCELQIVNATVNVNEKQKMRMVKKVTDAIGDLKGKVISILGLAFKNNTDDMRESAAITVINELANRGAKVKIYDPKAMDEAKWRLSHVQDSIIKYAVDEYDAVEGSDALIIITEWNQFRNLDLSRIKSLMNDKFFFDFRNIYSGETMREYDFNYYSVGR